MPSSEISGPPKGSTNRRLEAESQEVWDLRPEDESSTANVERTYWLDAATRDSLANDIGGQSEVTVVNRERSVNNTSTEGATVERSSAGERDAEASARRSGGAVNNSDGRSCGNVDIVENMGEERIDNDPPPEYNSRSIRDGDLDLQPPAYNDLSGPPFCYGFVNQGRSFLANNVHELSHESNSRHNASEARGGSNFLTLYNGMRVYLVPSAYNDSQRQQHRTAFANGERYQRENRDTIRAPEDTDEEAGNRFDRASNTSASSYVSCVVALVFWLIIPMAAFLIGVLFVDQCPIERHVPVFLIISGSVLLLRGMFFSFSRAKQSASSSYDCASTMGTFLDVFTIFWIVLGSFWIFSVIGHVSYELDDSGEMGKLYCNKTLFMFSLWFLIAFYILFLLAWLFVIVCICVYLSERKHIRRQRQRRNQVIRMRRRNNLLDDGSPRAVYQIGGNRYSTAAALTRRQRMRAMRNQRRARTNQIRRQTHATSTGTNTSHRSVVNSEN